ncbi:hypothetical protein ZHAS_00014905 [Anopheles sinensis]|uniref:Uncharacterized protein n=1 Tax=Anopheles sinensis TaxID=74873 RepID=A0A084W9K3_ANOSI|nr:hypothetical protein ZHAS_00014905 [Anopheles sinensis]
MDDNNSNTTTNDDDEDGHRPPPVESLRSRFSIAADCVTSGSPTGVAASFRQVVAYDYRSLDRLDYPGVNRHSATIVLIAPGGRQVNGPVVVFTISSKPTVMTRQLR